MNLKSILFFLLLFSSLASAQVRKYKAFSLSSREVDGSSWTQWSTPKDVDILISVNPDDNKIKIYSKVTQIYDIIKYRDKETDSDGDDRFEMYCEDADGANCNVDFVVLNSRNSRLQLYVRYSDMEWVYNIEPQ